MNIPFLLHRIFNREYEPSFSWDDYYAAGKQSDKLCPRQWEIIDLIELGSTILDVGCGDGLLLEFLCNYSYPRDILGIEKSIEACNIGRRRGLRIAPIDIEKWDAPSIPEQRNKWDYIIISEVLEHLKDPIAILQKLAKHTDHIIITVPNAGFWIERLRLFFGRFPQQSSDHIRFWTFKDFSVFLEAAGFKKNITTLKVIWKHKWLVKLWPNLFGSNIVCELKMEEA